jgi:hypothetical protein
MADTPTVESRTPGKPGVGGPTDRPESLSPGEAQRTFTAAERQAEAGVRAVRDAAQRTADVSEEAARANGEILRRNVEAAEDVVKTTVEVGMEGLTRTLSHAFEVVRPDHDLAEQSARNLRAISQASTSLAHVAQEATRAWLGLVRQSARCNLEAAGQLARCRSAPDLFALQTHLMRENLQLAIDAGNAFADVSTRMISEANRMIRLETSGR